jgi:hypothetical protein
LKAQAELINTLNSNLANTENTSRLLENMNQLMEINNQIDSLRPNSDSNEILINDHVIMEESNLGEETELIEPISNSCVWS